MSEFSNKAVFLSYASQDAEAAKRIADALRAAGVEVWFDVEGGLEHGDEWDAKIRRQIKECVLFIAVISDNTQAREEGYFRLEWDLAAERARTIAGGVVFILPVVVDDTKEPDALVPDRFRSVQWTKLPGGNVSPEVLQRFLKLWSHRIGVVAQRSPSVSAIREPLPAPTVLPAWRRWLPLAMALIVALIAFGAWRLPREPAPAPAPAAPPLPVAAKPTPIEEKSIAVLAFANLSDDKANEYFSDGISEELLNVLCKVPGLQVTARTSSFHFKGLNTAIPEIAKQLGVAYVVEGSVRKAGGQVRITAQLIKAADGFHVWSDTFTRELKDVFAVQDEIAGLIAQNLQLTLRTKTRARTVNPEAYELLLKGRAFLSRGTPAEYPQGIQYLKDSLAIDPESAPTWSRLATGYVLAFAQTVPGWLPRDELIRLARQAADRAIALDPEQPFGHQAQCFISYFADWDWARADASMQRVLALTPGDAESLGLAASLQMTAGHPARARDAAIRAVLLDPLNFPPAYHLMKALWQAGDYAGLEKESKRMIAIHPGSPYGHTFLCYSLILRGRADEAAQVAEHVTTDFYRLTSLALARYAQGKLGEADAELEQLKKQFGATDAYQIAENYAFRKDLDRAFEWLEAAYRQRDSGLTLITNDPFVANLRGDARWSAFMRKMNLPDGGTK